MKLSLIIPCYNEDGNVKKMHDLVEKTFNDCGYEYEMVFVNDGSTDNTSKELKSLYKNSKSNVKVVSFSRNFGKEPAIYAGLKESRGDYVTLIDADLQQDPAIAREMVEMLDDNDDLDCITAYQEKRKEGKLLSSLKNFFYKIINKVAEVELKEGASDFRTLRRNMVNAILEMNEYYRFSKGIFSWVGFNNHFIPYHVNERATGNTKWSFTKLFKYAIDGIVAFTTMPLRVSTVIGILSSICSVFYILFVVIQKIFFDIAVPGYATIVVLILLLGGLQLFALGIIGEYIARTYVETKKRPIYIAKEILDYEKSEENKAD